MRMEDYLYGKGLNAHWNFDDWWMEYHRQKGFTDAQNSSTVIKPQRYSPSWYNIFLIDVVELECYDKAFFREFNQVGVGDKELDELYVDKPDVRVDKVSRQKESSSWQVGFQIDWDHDGSKRQSI